MNIRLAHLNLFLFCSTVFLLTQGAAQGASANQGAAVAKAACDNEALQASAAQVVITNNPAAQGLTFIFSKIKTVSAPMEKKLQCSALVWMVKENQIVGGQTWSYGLTPTVQGTSIFVDPVSTIQSN